MIEQRLARPAVCNVVSLNRHLIPQPPEPVEPPVPPMWGLWLNDPSGKYGNHKPFFEHGATAADAAASALARYRVPGTAIDETRAPFILNPAR